MRFAHVRARRGQLRTAAVRPPTTNGPGVGAVWRQDLNLRSAYLHVLADALTSALAIVAHFGGKLFGWVWLDPVMGIVGAAVISVWA